VAKYYTKHTVIQIKTPFLWFDQLNYTSYLKS